MPEPITVRHLSDMLLASRAVSPGTLGQFAATVNLIDRWNGGPAIADEFFTDDKVREWLTWLRPGREAATVNSKLRMVKQLWLFLEDRAARVGDVNCRVPPPRRNTLIGAREPKRIPTAWTAQDVSRILAHVSAAPRRRHFTADHWRALILTLFDTGARIQALLHCRQTDVRNGRLHLDAAHDKTVTEHCYPLSKQTRHAIAKLPPHEFLFPWGKTTRSIARLRVDFSAILKAAGLPHTRGDKFHKLRRTRVTQTAKIVGLQGASESIGHATVAVTRRYVDTRLLTPTVHPDQFDRPE